MDILNHFTALHWVLSIIVVLALIFGAVLGFSSVKLKVESDPIVDKIDAILPQSQCGQCGYPGCRPYAEAIANGDVITKCVPGGQPLVVQLADMLGMDVPQTNFADGPPEVKVAFIHEEMCIGCTKCIQACPVDAIIGSNKALHTVIADLCTGCELCVAPCPTDCISMETVKTDIKQWNWKFDPDLIIPISTITEKIAPEREVRP
ncbi:electron transport complex subunit RsxB [Chelonobacter oris]|uniref:Ion-translocating oxidoreductase complex subunit B n=1 Tax=Chelonobacter oris TaxID=505317 RepID=A0A0A3AVQ6_9PAST|nr:electron transport complex subunit RsxB [Chelonobacter oris]KGQ71140.1 electron transporter RnfB [Chelonobacter oris]MDH3000127.1 electron transport complex subunit RsxB [Chelonobacter oris]